MKSNSLAVDLFILMDVNIVALLTHRPSNLAVRGHDNNLARASGVTRSMVIPGPETEVIGESGSGGLGAQPPDAEKGLILHVLRIS